jgi:site-specific recombinase XerD
MRAKKSIHEAVQDFLESVALSRSDNTARTYKNALNAFSQVLEDHNLEPDENEITSLKEDAISWFASYLKSYSPTTERLYLTAVNGFYEFLAAERLSEPNLPRVRMLIRQRARRVGQRLPQFPKIDIERVLKYANDLAIKPAEDEMEKLRYLRDRAFLITLANTGLRVHEACGLRRGDIDWNEGKAIIIGKGDQQAVVRFSMQTIRVLRDYLNSRSHLDGGSGRSLTSLPLFARHDKGAGKNIKPITTTTGRNIVANGVAAALGPQAKGRERLHLIPFGITLSPQFFKDLVGI